MLVPRDTDIFNRFFRNFRNDPAQPDPEDFLIDPAPPPLRQSAVASDTPAPDALAVSAGTNNADPITATETANEENGNKIFSYFQRLAEEIQPGDNLYSANSADGKDDFASGALQRFFEMTRERAEISDTEEKIRDQAAETRKAALSDEEAQIFVREQEASEEIRVSFYENFVRDDEERHKEYLERRKTEIEKNAAALAEREEEIRKAWRSDANKRNPIKKIEKEMEFLAGLLFGKHEDFCNYSIASVAPPLFFDPIRSRRSGGIKPVGATVKIQPIRRGDGAVFFPFLEDCGEIDFRAKRKKIIFQDRLLFLNEFYRKERILRRGRDPPSL